MCAPFGFVGHPFRLVRPPLRVQGRLLCLGFPFLGSVGPPRRCPSHQPGCIGIPHHLVRLPLRRGGLPFHAGSLERGRFCLVPLIIGCIQHLLDSEGSPHLRMHHPGRFHLVLGPTFLVGALGPLLRLLVGHIRQHPLPG
jgi:hypothetical protein